MAHNIGMVCIGIAGTVAVFIAFCLWAALRVARDEDEYEAALAPEDRDIARRRLHWMGDMQ